MEFVESGIRILLIEDDEDDYVLIRDSFTKLPESRFVLDWAPDSKRAMDAIQMGSYDISP